MKKTSKIFVIILALSIIIGTAFALSVSANEEKSPVILSKNVAYEGNFALMYAVSADSVEQGPVTLEIYFDPTAEKPYRTYVQDTVETITISGEDYQVYEFKTAGIAAKDMLDTVWAKAVDGAGNVSELTPYSVAEYLFERLTTPGISEIQKNIYNAALDLGNNVQKLLCPDETPIDSYSYVKVYDTLLPDGSTAGIFPIGAQFTPEFTGTAPEGMTFAGWKVVDLNGNVTEYKANATLTLGAPCTVSARFTAPVTNGYEDGSLPGSFAYDIGQGNGSGELSSLSVVDGYDTNTSKVLKFSVDGNRNACVKMNLDNVEKNGNAYVFETDINADSFSSSYPIFYLYLRNADGTNIYALEFTYISAGDAKVFRMRDISSGSASTSQNGASIQIADQWFNLRVEYFPAEDKNDVRFKTYIDGKLTYVSDNYYKDGESRLTLPLGYARLQCYSSAKYDIYLDNTGFYTAELEKGDEPLGLVNGFEGAYTHPTKNYYVVGTPFWGYAAAEGGSIKTVTEGFNTFMRISTNGKISSESNRKIHLEKTVAKDHDVNAFVLDTEIRINLTTEGSFNLCGEDSTLRQYFKVEQIDGKIYIDGVSAFNANEWVRLRMQYYNNEGTNMVRVLVGDTVIVDKQAGTGANILNFAKFSIVLSQSIVGTVDLDNTFVGVTYLN